MTLDAPVRIAAHPSLTSTRQQLEMIPFIAGMLIFFVSIALYPQRPPLAYAIPTLSVIVVLLLLSLGMFTMDVVRNYRTFREHVSKLAPDLTKKQINKLYEDDKLVTESGTYTASAIQDSFDKLVSFTPHRAT